MLPAAHRLTTREGFRSAVRLGRRAAGHTVVVHVWLDGAGQAPPEQEPVTPARVGFVVGRAVGNAVTRNRVKRRLRHQVRDLLAVLPPSAVLVVRALPTAATVTSRELSADLTRCLERVLPAGATASMDPA